MKVLVTGASGFIGSAVAAALARDGHQTAGLVRSDAKARALAAAEVEPVLGTLEEPAAWIARAAAADATVHCAAEPSARFHALDRAAVRALLLALASAGRPRLLVYTSGVWIYGDTRGNEVDETASLAPPALVAPRAETEGLVLAAARGALRTIVLRPGCVYGGSGSLTAAWFESAAREGAARIVGEGSNRWAMVHRDDLASLYASAVRSDLSAEVLNATDAGGSSVRECAAAASRAAGRGGAVASTDPAEAARTLGPLAACLALDQRVSSRKAARLLGWDPRHAGFVECAESCFCAWRAAAEGGP